MKAIWSYSIYDRLAFGGARFPLWGTGGGYGQERFACYTNLGDNGNF